jgi:hypothetical protein
VYAFENFTDDLDRGDIRGAVIGAFAAWSRVTRLTFSEVASDDAPDLRLRWVIGDHGDGNPFDGFGGTYAHAFFPQEGRIHFDDDERWTDTAIGLFLGPDLQTLATHEIGHALGAPAQLGGGGHHATTLSAAAPPALAAPRRRRGDPGDLRLARRPLGLAWRRLHLRSGGLLALAGPRRRLRPRRGQRDLAQVVGGRVRGLVVLIPSQLHAKYLVNATELK